MSKPTKKPVAKEETTQEQKPLAQLTNVAYSIVKHPLDNKYYFVRVSYDPISKEAGNVVMQQVEGKDYAIELFKITTAQEGLFS